MKYSAFSPLWNYFPAGSSFVTAGCYTEEFNITLEEFCSCELPLGIVPVETASSLDAQTWPLWHLSCHAWGIPSISFLWKCWGTIDVSVDASAGNLHLYCRKWDAFKHGRKKLNISSVCFWCDMQDLQFEVGS